MKSGIGMKDLKIVIVKKPFDLWANVEDRSFPALFHEMIGLKLRGYGAEYPAGVLPVDTSDFIATHLLVCRREGEAWIPLTGFKSTLLSDCDAHRVSFPALGLVQSAEAPAHVRYVRETMERCSSEGASLAYTGSWTIEPGLRKDRALAQELVALFKAMYVFHHLDERIDEVFTGGTIRFKADVLLGRMGHDPIIVDGLELPPLRVRHLFDEPVSLLHLRSFSESARSGVEPFRRMWEERVVFAVDSAVGRESAKRAA